MKRKILAAIMILVLALAAAGCGSSGGNDGSDDQIGKMEIAPKTLTDDEQHIMSMLGASNNDSTGILEFNGNDQMKSVGVKIMEYHAGAKKWSCIHESRKKVGKSGEIIVSYSEDGTQLDCYVSNGKDEVSGSSVSGIKKFPKNKDGMGESGATVGAPLVLNKDIAVHMIVYSKPNDEHLESPNMQDYPKLEEFKDYQYVRAVVLNFSDKSLNAE